MSGFPSKEAFKRIINELGVEEGYDFIEKHKAIQANIAEINRERNEAYKQYREGNDKLSIRLKEQKQACSHPDLVDVFYCAVCGKVVEDFKKWSKQ